MAITVETGSGVSGSNSYDSVANCQTYYTDMGYSDTPTSATMIRGSRTLDALYRHALKGTKVASGQSMAWPRFGMTDEDGNAIGSDTIPTLWKQAAYELARVVPTDQSVDATKWLKRVKAGSVEVEFAGSFKVRSVLEMVDDLVSPYLRPQRSLVRA